MKRLHFLFMLAPFALSCEEGADDSSAEADADTDADSDTDTDTDGIVSGLAWRLHDDMGSMVYVSWMQSEEGNQDAHVEYSFDDGVWLSSPKGPSTKGFNERLVVGIPFDELAEFKVVVGDTEYLAKDTIDTADVPVGLPVGTVHVADDSKWLSQGNYLLTCINQEAGGWRGGTYWTYIMDRQGRPVWAQAAPDGHWTLFPSVSQSRDHILWDEATKWSDWDDGEGSEVHRTYLDQHIETVATPGLHHAFVELPDQTLVWGSQYHGGGEALVEKAKGGKDVVLWTCTDDWPGSGGGCESNGLFYVEKTNSFLYSFYTNNSVVEVNRSTGESMWWAGDVGGGYSFDPANSQFSWQHGISYTDTGSLLVSSEAVGKGGSGHTTMLREYIVDHNAETLTEIWNFDAEEYASTNGDAWRLQNGNSLHVVGSAGHVKEVDPDANVVWHVDYDANKLMGRGEFIEDLYTLVSGL